jgi:hypothetical protein
MRFEKPKNAEQIGAGAHKRVYHERASDPHFVHAEYRYPHTNEQMKSVFYLSNIVHELFPEHTVRVAQSGNGKDGVAWARVEFVAHDDDPLHTALQKEMLVNDEYDHDSPHLDGTHDRTDNDSRVQTFLDAYDAAGLYYNSASLHAWGGQDAIYNKEGNFKFVDVNPAWYEPDDIGQEKRDKYCLAFDPLKLMRAIDALPIRRRIKAKSYYRRLMALCKEVGFVV